MTTGKTIQSRLYDSFQKHGPNIAVEYKDLEISYTQLDRLSNIITQELLTHKVPTGTFIGILLEDKAAILTVILGIIKANCVFVPLDTRYPDRRLRAMLEESRLKMVFTSGKQLERLTSIHRHLDFHLEIFSIDEDFLRPGQQLESSYHPNNTKLSPAEKTRYARHLLMDHWGLEGQERLKGSTVFAAGAGGSGSPLIQQLALCGFGNIIICDFDTVDLSNLNRQSLHDESRIGMNKAVSAQKTVERMNPNVNVIVKTEKITRDNVFDLVGDAEIIFDNVDSLEAKSVLSRCAVAKGIPHTISSMIHINSYACVFHPPHTPCFHCLYDKQKIDDITEVKKLTEHYKAIPNAVASPSLHLSTGFIVNEAVKILLGMGKPAYNKYFHFNQFGSPEIAATNGFQQITYPFSQHFKDLAAAQGFDWTTGWSNRFVEEITLEPNPDCPHCRTLFEKSLAKTSDCTARADSHVISDRSVLKQMPPQTSTTASNSPQSGVQGEPPPGPRRAPGGPPEAMAPPLPSEPINIYFTSGTTGKPKAILGKNEGMTHFIAWEIKRFGIGAGSRVSQLTSQCHDPYLRDIFVPLCAGATLCIPPDRETILDGGRLKQWLETSRVNLVHCTPSLFKNILDGPLEPRDFPDLQQVLLAGEKITPPSLEPWFDAVGDRVQLVNVYGPTETTLAKVFYPIQPADVRRDNMPIGKPIPGGKVIILDKDRKPCDPGVVGEIYIRTPYRSLGYLDDDNLNAEKFIPNPFSQNPRDIIYKTGDLGKLNRDGDIEFTGRKDRQIKIRGFRVELEEIEKRALRFPGVQDAVILHVVTATGNQVLCAYYTGDISEPELKKHLAAELPDYMVPHFLIKMESFPLTSNGKINTRALPRPDEVDRGAYTPPANPLEEQMAATWGAVLGLDKIGVTEGFLDMGGNSLNAMNLIAGVYKEFGVNLQLSAIFRNLTVRELAATVRQSEQSLFQGISPAPEQEYYPLSSAQMRMVLLREFAGEDDISYNQTKPLLISGNLDRHRLEQTFIELVQRHETLRTGFETVGTRPVQRVHQEVVFKVETIPLPGPGESQIIEAIAGFVKPFDMARPPLLRVGLARLEAERHIVVFDIHHIISDGVTTGIFIDEFMKAYSGETLASLTIQYKDYALWQQEMLESGAMKEMEQYWLGCFAEEVPVLNLPTDFPRPPVQSFEGARFDFQVPLSLVLRMETLARARNATLYMAVLALYTTLLHRYTGQEDIVVGSPIAGRPHKDLQHIPGVFINTLAMRNRPQPGKTFLQLLKETADTAFKAYENQDYPFEELVGKLELSRDTSRNPLYETMLVFQNIDQKSLSVPGLEIAPYPFDNRTSKFDLSLNVLQTSEGPLFNIEYATRLFRPGFIRQLARHLQVLMETAAGEPGTRLDRMELLAPGEKERILVEFNNTQVEYTGASTIHGMFHRIAETAPDRTALVFKDRYISYGELRQRARALAAQLRTRGVGPDTIVGLVTTRTPETLTATLAILDAGGAYMPIPPEYPEERKQYMLKDSNTRLVLSTQPLETPANIEILSPGDSTAVPISPQLGVQGEPPPGAPRAGAPGGPPEATLVYLLYTSGSTGRPKGVMLEHRALVNLMNFTFERTGIDNSRMLLFHTMGFDVSFHELAGALLSGGELYIIEEEMLADVPALFRLVEQNDLPTLFLPMSYLRMVFNDPGYTALFPRCVRHIQSAGEQVVLHAPLRRFLRENNVTFHNHYGPAEAHVVTTLTIPPGEDIPELPSIGKPVANTAIYILDKQGHPQPTNIPGELYIGGTQLGRGYLNSPELTAEGFAVFPIPNQRATAPLYRTGELARWREDGNIEFLGRMDQQVKIRGFRIEPGEIESRLLEMETVKEAVVIAHRATGDAGDAGGEILLYAYYTATNEPDPENLAKHLAASLPDYMIPHGFIPVENIPLTPSGKVDRRALPAPEIKVGSEITPPGNPMEEKLLTLWAEVLETDINSIGIDTDFFRLGGHSLKGTLIISRVHREFNVKITLADLFRNPTIRMLARRISSAARETFAWVEPSEDREYYPLSHHQKRLWLLDKIQGSDTSYHMPLRIQLNHPVEAGHVHRALRLLATRHHSLRTAIKDIRGIPFQFIKDDVPVNLDTRDISGEPPQEKKRLRQELFQDLAAAPFDFTAAPLYRALLLKWDNDGYDLLVIMHHVITDGWSMHLLEQDFSRFYNHLRNRREPDTQPPELQYRDFCRWQHLETGGQRGEVSHRFWLEKLRNGLPILHLPAGAPDNRKNNLGAAFQCSVTPEVTRRLDALAETNRTTLSMVMFTVYNILLAHLSNQQEVVCSLISAGRDHLGLHGIAGYFTTSVPIKTRFHDEDEFENLLMRVHADVTETLQHQDYPLEPVLDELNMPAPEITVCYNMLNLPGPPREPAGPEEESRHLEKMQGVKFDLTLFVSQRGNALHLLWNYKKNMFSPGMIESIVETYTNLLDELSE